MGVVYRAVQLDLQRPVALKVITADRAGDPEFRERFARESRMAAAIDHPNVVPVYAAGEERGALYIVMRYVPGRDLHALIKDDGPLPATRAAAIVAQVAAALDVAHAAGLVHRDVKPANVLLAARLHRPRLPQRLRPHAHARPARAAHRQRQLDRHRRLRLARAARRRARRRALGRLLAGLRALRRADRRPAVPARDGARDAARPPARSGPAAVGAGRQPVLRPHRRAGARQGARRALSRRRAISAAPRSPPPAASR